METMEASAFEQMIVKLGLVSEDQLAEVHDEIGPVPDLQHLIAALERKSYLTPWQRGKVLKGDTDGFILGGYIIQYKIQSGSFGRVFRAVDPRDGSVVAVKVLRRRWSEDQVRIDMFIREGKVGLQLEHSNIVKVLAINRDAASAQYYLVMEFVEGGNLREILQIRKKLTVAESLRIADDAANGLAYAYARGMTHRDIKLTNVLISSLGEAKLVDFGLAQFFSTLAKREEEKVDRTVDYAGLERATDVKMGDVRSDIYFLGCVLYEALTGRPPLAMTRDKHARMRKERFEEVRPIRPEEINGPPSVLVLVETMMALDPKERHQTPAQLIDAIRAVRREVEGKSSQDDGRAPSRSVFVVENDEHLQDVLRDSLKDQGYRVLLAGDPRRALDRFHQQPYDGLIVDARTTGEEGFRLFAYIVDEADRRRLSCAALVLLDEEQGSWAQRLPQAEHVGVLVQHITFKTVARKLKELMEAAHGPEVSAPVVSEVQRPTPAAPDLEGLLDEEAAPPPRRDPMAASASRPFSLPREEAVSPPRQFPSRRPTNPPPMRHVPYEAFPAAVPPDPHSWRDEFGPSALTKNKEGAGSGGQNIWAKLLSNRIGILAISVVVLMLGLLVFFVVSNVVTDTKFEEIKSGMTEAEVENILGEAEEVTAAKSAKRKKWVRGGTTITVWFDQGKVKGAQRIKMGK